MKEKIFLSIVLSYLLLLSAPLMACDIAGSYTANDLGMEVEKKLNHFIKMCDWTLDDIVRSDLILKCRELTEKNILPMSKNVKIVKANFSQDLGPHCTTLVTGMQKDSSFDQSKVGLVVCDDQSEKGYYNFCINKDAFMQEKEKMVKKIKQEQKDNVNFHPGNENTDPSNYTSTVGVRG